MRTEQNLLEENRAVDFLSVYARTAKKLRYEKLTALNSGLQTGRLERFIYHFNEACENDVNVRCDTFYSVARFVWRRFCINIPDKSEKTLGVWRPLTLHLAIRMS